MLDYAITDGILSNYDKNNKLMFFLNCEDGFSKIDTNQSNFDIDKEIICSECAMNWKCHICESMYVINNDDTFVIKNVNDKGEQYKMHYIFNHSEMTHKRL